MHRLESIRIVPLAIVSILLVASGCAAASAPVTDLNAFVGEWSGSGARTDGLSGPWRVVIKANQTYESHSPLGSTTGTITVKDGKALSKNDQTGRTGVFWLGEGRGGTRKLLFRSDDGITTGELEPAAGR